MLLFTSFPRRVFLVSDLSIGAEIVSISDPTKIGIFCLLLLGVTISDGLNCSCFGDDSVGMMIASFKVKVDCVTGPCVVDGELDVGFDGVVVVVDGVVKNVGRAVVIFCAISMNDGKSSRNEVTVVEACITSLSTVWLFSSSVTTDGRCLSSTLVLVAMGPLGKAQLRCHVSWLFLVFFKKLD